MMRALVSIQAASQAVRRRQIIAIAIKRETKARTGNAGSLRLSARRGYAFHGRRTPPNPAIPSPSPSPSPYLLFGFPLSPTFFVFAGERAAGRERHVRHPRLLQSKCSRRAQLPAAVRRPPPRHLLGGTRLGRSVEDKACSSICPLISSLRCRGVGGARSFCETGRRAPVLVPRPGGDATGVGPEDRGADAPRHGAGVGGKQIPRLFFFFSFFFFKVVAAVVVPALRHVVVVPALRHVVVTGASGGGGCPHWRRALAGLPSGAPPGSRCNAIRRERRR